MTVGWTPDNVARRFINPEFNRDPQCPCHGGMVVGVGVLPAANLFVSTGWDDTVRFADLESGQYLGESAPTGDQPTGLR